MSGSIRNLTSYKNVKIEKINEKYYVSLHDKIYTFEKLINALEKYHDLIIKNYIK